MISIRRSLTIATLVLAGGLLVACSGGGSGKTQGKIDSANDDNRRLSLIEANLASLGVMIPNRGYSMSNIFQMDAQGLQQVRDLLDDFVRRARAIVSVGERKDVKILDSGRMAYIAGEIGQAEQLRRDLDRVAAQATKKADCDGIDARTYTTIARRGAAEYLSGLDRSITRRVNFDQPPAVDPVIGSCTQLRVIFADQQREGCTFTVVMEQGTVVHDRSSHHFVCH